MRKTIIELVDDIDPNRTEAVQTVTFGFEGQDYEIDLAPDHYAMITEALTPFIEHGRRMKISRKGKTRVDGNAARIREWARSQGIAVPERGRVPETVRQAYFIGHAR